MQEGKYISINLWKCVLQNLQVVWGSQMSMSQKQRPKWFCAYLRSIRIFFFYFRIENVKKTMWHIIGSETV